MVKNKSLNNICFSKNEQLPTVAILLSAYNEEKIIAQKIESVLSQNYPSELLHIYIGNDASTDNTQQIIHQFQIKNKNIRIATHIIQSGKTTFINKLAALAIEQLGAEIILLPTDANTIFDKNICFELVKHFKNAEIGLVGANVLNKSATESAVADMEALYISKENEIKYHEGLLNGAMMGAFGAAYAIRSISFFQVPNHYIVEDFFITMQVHQQKLKCIMEPKAICIEDVPGNMWIEFKRKSRIAAGNFQNYFYFTQWLIKPFTPVGFTYISHKVLRWLTPFMAIASIFLVAILANYYWFYYYIFWYKFIFWIFFFADIVLVYFNIHFKPLRMLTYFYFMNMAIVVGFIKFLKGIKSSAWKPTDRNI
jgi:cellulose synthase/poly-beta-1,6-N-acetylglucosamine synthase-like glycosyltransferase